MIELTRTNILCVVPTTAWLCASMARIKVALANENIPMWLYDMDQRIIETKRFRLYFSTTEVGLHGYDKLIGISHPNDSRVHDLVKEIKDAEFSMEGLSMAGFKVIYKDALYTVYDITEDSYQIHIDGEWEYVPKELCEVV